MTDPIEKLLQYMIERDQKYAEERRQEGKRREDILTLIREICNQNGNSDALFHKVCQKIGKFTHDPEDSKAFAVQTAVNTVT